MCTCIDRSTSELHNFLLCSRVERLLKDGVTVMGGESDKDDLYIAPTLIIDVDNDDVTMEDEVRDMCIHHNICVSL